MRCGYIATLREWLTPLILLSAVETIAGLFLRLNLELLVAYPILLVILPGLMDLRGDVYGAMGYRLSKGLHLGATSPRLLTRFNLINMATAYVASITVTFSLTLIGLLLSYFKGLASPDIASLMFITFSSTLIVFILLTPITVGTIVRMFKKGQDPSPFVATIVTGIGDVLTPVALISVTYLYESLGPGLRKLTILMILASTLVLTFYLIYKKESRDLMENFISSLIGSTGSSIGGYFLATRVELISTVPLLLAVIPAFNAVLGAAMGYFSNTVNIQLHLGLRGEKTVTFYKGILMILISVSTSVVMALFVVSALFPPGLSIFAYMLAVVTLSCLVLSLISVSMTYTLTMMSFNRGWDPDNLVFPVMTTFVDMSGPIVVLSFALLLFL